MSSCGLDVGFANAAVTLLVASSSDATAFKSAYPTLLNNERSQQTTPAVVSYAARRRCCGQQALDEAPRNARNTLWPLLAYLDAAADGSAAPSSVRNVDGAGPFAPLEFDADSHAPCVRVSYACEPKGVVRAAQAAAVFVKRLGALAMKAASGENAAPVARCQVAVAPTVSEQGVRELLLAMQVAGLPNPSVVRTSVALVHAFVASRELPATPSLALIVDVGHGHCAAVVARVSRDEGAVVLGEASAPVGGGAIDAALMARMAAEVRAKVAGANVLASDRMRVRLWRQVESLKAMLSTVQETEFVLENASDAGDFRQRVRRDIVVECAAPLLDAVERVVRDACVAAGVGSAFEQLGTVDVVGGSVRVPCVAERIEQVVGRAVTRTLDGSAAAACGAALVDAPHVRVTRADGAPIAVSGPLAADDATLAALASAERDVFGACDADLEREEHARNALESSVFDLRSLLRDHLERSVPAAAIAAARELCDSTEMWVAEETDADTPAAVYDQRRAAFESSIPAEVRAARDAHLEAVAAQRREAERIAAEAAARNAAEMANVLDTAARLKDKGNTLFKSGQYEEAVNAYVKAVNSFFQAELGRKEEEQADAIKLSCFLNMCACHVRLKQYSECVRVAGKALEIDPANAKALFRRGQAYTGTKEFDLADADLKRANELTPDNADIVNAITRLRQLQAEAKTREKQMFARMFA